MKYKIKFRNRYFTFLITFVLISSIIFIFCSHSVFSSKTLYVGGNSTGNFTLIQEAVENATEGDVIYVYNGTYNENLVINVSINLVGEDNKTTIIDGEAKLYSLYLKHDYVSISNFFIKNSSAGIFIYGPNSSYNSIDSCIFSNLSDGIHLINSSNNNISNNIIKDLTSKAIVFWNSSKNSIFKNLIVNNIDGIKFGQFCNKNLIMLNNLSFNSNAIDFEYSYFNVIKNNTIYENVQGIHFLQSKNNSIIGNNIEKTEVYAVHIPNINSNILTENVFIDNYVNIKEKLSPPTIKASGFEFILFLFCLLICFLLIYKRK